MNFLEKLAGDVKRVADAKLSKLGAGPSLKGPGKPGASATGAAVSKSPTATPPPQRPAAPVPTAQMAQPHSVNPPPMSLQVAPINGAIPGATPATQPIK
jgi:hypothetical protein